MRTVLSLLVEDRAELPTLERAPPLTLHKFHDDVDGLFLRADADETHDVGMAVLL